jgi:curved DNA-binding protein CbpA
MKSAFDLLGIPVRLQIEENALKQAFREAGKMRPPDGGGSEADFAELRQAYETLSSPSKRLAHWLSLRGEAMEARGAISAHLMDLFIEMGAITQEAESVIRKRDGAKSALTLALTESGTQHCREKVEAMGTKISAAIHETCQPFSSADWFLDGAASATLVRDLAFLEKWRSGLRALFSRLV